MSIIRDMVVSGKQFEGPFSADGPDGFIRYTVGFNNFATAATTVNYDLPNFPAGALLEDAFFVNRQNWTGGAIASATMSIGTVASPTLYVLAKSVFGGAPAALGVVNADKGVGITSPQTLFLNQATPWTAPTTVRVQLVTSANANTLTQGRCDIFLLMRAVSVRPV
jgi:hypothetical protein